jgi:5-methylcytosine-specific restriction endonuclease McrA
MTSLNSINAVGVLDKKNHRLLLNSKNFVDLLVPPSVEDLNYIKDGQHVQIIGKILQHPTKLNACIVIPHCMDLFPGDSSPSCHIKVTMQNIQWNHPELFTSVSSINGDLGNGEKIVVQMPLIQSRWERKIGGTFGKDGGVDMELSVVGTSRLICQDIVENRSHQKKLKQLLRPQTGSTEEIFIPSKQKKTRKGVGPKLRREVMIRDNYTCKECGISPDKATNVFLEVDHIHPVSKGGSNDFSNLQTLCNICNSGKSNKVTSGKIDAASVNNPWV